MSLRSEEKQLKAEHRQLLRKRRRALEAKNFTWAQRRGIEARRVKQKIQSIHRRRVGTYRPSMLDGHPGNVSDAVKRVIAVAYKFADERNTVCTVTATTNGTHTPTSLHYAQPLGKAVDLIFATVAQMIDFQAFCLQHTPNEADDFLELFGPANWYVKNGSKVPGAFPSHGDHNHIGPDFTYRVVKK